ncbi:hypothetical protein AAYQ05_16970, partial [Flavobacterium sp. B11]|uniref:hypothetical protein n=1 Tax=Flavobacterium movens TaxID=214860 RepID=UPI0031D20F97
MFWKKSFCKEAVIRLLRKKEKKDQKNPVNKLGKAEKGSTFAPATAKGVHRNTGMKEGSEEKKFSEKKDSEK